MADTADQIARVQRGITGFVAEVRALNIHVGMGRDPHCVTCGERWPCEASKPGRDRG